MSARASKPCKDCCEVLSIQNFYRHPSYADGRVNSCKPCYKAAIAENRTLKADYYRAQKKAIASRAYARAQRAAYQRSERGREVHRRACRVYHRNRKLFGVAA